MSWFSDFLRRRRIDPQHRTRRALARHIEKRGFQVGDYSYGAPIVRFWGPSGKLIIGSYCSIAANVEIFLGGNHRTAGPSTYPFHGEVDQQVAGDVVIGSDVWIGFGATILSGVRIGHGAVVGARAVVAKDVPPYGIVVGNPASLARLRFSEPTVEELLRIRWWDLPREEIVALIPLLSGETVEPFLDECRRRGYAKGA